MQIETFWLPPVNVNILSILAETGGVGKGDLHLQGMEVFKEQVLSECP